MKHDYLYSVFPSSNSVCAGAMFILGLLISVTINAHEVVVHREITSRAVDRSGNYMDFLASVFGRDDAGVPQNPKFGISTGKQWMEEGSEREDDGSGVAQRAFNHFYDPINKQGLSDTFGFPHALGKDSFTWATDINALDSRIGYNAFNWPSARYYQYAALTSSSKEERDDNFAAMFRAVGQVLHLLEDTSQPEHVRNTQHLDKYPNGKPSPFRSYIEEYGRDNYPKIFENPYAYYRANLLPSPSTQNGIKSLWDRDVLSSGSSDLGASDELLGLAEFTNKNFLGIRSLYGELSSAGGIHHYAHPSLNETNVNSVLEAFGQVGVAHNVDKDGVVRNGIYISKSASRKLVFDE